MGTGVVGGLCKVLYVYSGREWRREWRRVGKREGEERGGEKGESSIYNLALA